MFPPFLQNTQPTLCVGSPLGRTLPKATPSPPRSLIIVKMAIACLSASPLTVCSLMTCFRRGFGSLFLMLPVSSLLMLVSFLCAGVLPAHLACRCYHGLNLQVGHSLALFFFQICQHRDSVILTGI